MIQSCLRNTDMKQISVVFQVDFQESNFSAFYARVQQFEHNVSMHSVCSYMI